MAKTPPPQHTKESLYLSSKINEAGATQAQIAELLDVTPGFVSQLVTGRRPVPRRYARKLAEFLKAVPEKLSIEYAEVLTADGGTTVQLFPVSDQRRPDLIISRLENDVDSLRLALGTLITVMSEHRPAEARDVLKQFRRKIPAKFAKQGYIADLIAILDRAGMGADQDD